MRRAQTCVYAGVLLQTALADEGLVADAAVELLGGVVQRAVHLQAVLVGEGLAAHAAGVRADARVVEHVDAQRVELGQRLAADVADELPFRTWLDLALFLALLAARGVLGRRPGQRRCPLCLLVLVPGHVGSQGCRVLEFLIA